MKLEWEIRHPSTFEEEILPTVEQLFFYSASKNIDFCDTDSKDFSLAFDRLRTGRSTDSRERIFSNFDDRGTQTCPCTNCTDDELKSSRDIRSREISSMKLVVQGPEILNYQGIQYTPDDIARYWKKDSRMWLWKSVRLARKRMNENGKTLPINCTPKSEQNKLE